MVFGWVWGSRGGWLGQLRVGCQLEYDFLLGGLQSRYRYVLLFLLSLETLMSVSPSRSIGARVTCLNRGVLTHCTYCLRA